MAERDATRTGAAVTPARGRTAAIVGALVALIGIVAACAPPVAPPPEVLPQPDGRGIVSESDVAPSAGCDSPADEVPPVGTSTLSIPWQGGTRTALLSVPDATPAAPRPLLVSLHPFTQGPEGWEDYSGLAAAATDRGYVVVSPLGSEPGPRWAVPGGLESAADDIGFVSALADHLEDRLCIDRNREVAAGYSAGAAMAQALSCTLPWRFTAVAGSGGMNLTDLCPESPPTDVFVLHGSIDPVAPAEGSYVVFAPPLGLSILSVVGTDAARAGCDPSPVLATPHSDVAARTYQGCDDDTRVQFWEMVGSGHTWAGAESAPLDLFVGPTSQTFSATDEVLDFFDAA